MLNAKSAENIILLLSRILAPKDAYMQKWILKLSGCQNNLPLYKTAMYNRLIEEQTCKKIARLKTVAKGKIFLTRIWKSNRVGFKVANLVLQVLTGYN